MENIQILKLRNERLQLILDLLSRRHPPGSRYYNPETFEALREIICRKDKEISQRQNNPWLKILYRLEPLRKRRWFQKLTGLCRGAIEPLVISGIMPQQIGRYRVIDCLLDLEG